MHIFSQKNILIQNVNKFRVRYQGECGYLYRIPSNQLVTPIVLDFLYAGADHVVLSNEDVNEHVCFLDVSEVIQCMK